ncbi:hypothetical protein B0A54_10403 [Friedmanniomyces endolithicus]|uniref:Uncharacterized protein n=1 Tax=Friedmanniomyces endolithicus TaxID=329885 RepID=A0A4U0UTR7_9PEZI|nr:hypothetical protein B0A54_10403 [Friedmanniomyces endolithicus]
MPRAVAPPPSNEFEIRLTKPFSGPPKHTIEVIGSPNRSASIRTTTHTSPTQTSHKTGDVPADDVQELLRLVSELRGFPSHPSKDIYEKDVKVDFNTFEIQWGNGEEESSPDSVKEIAGEQKEDFGRIAESIEATFAKKDAAV